MSIDSKAIFEQVKENQRKLNSCTLHRFTTDLNPTQPYLKRWRCAFCGGEVDGTTKHWYEKGLEHAKGAKP